MTGQRFDLSESSQALGVIADRSPAWCEVYGTILGHFVDRHLTCWPAIDWITHIGPGPPRSRSGAGTTRRNRFAKIPG